MSKEKCKCCGAPVATKNIIGFAEFVEMAKRHDRARAAYAFAAACAVWGREGRERNPAKLTETDARAVIASMDRTKRYIEMQRKERDGLT